MAKVQLTQAAALAAIFKPGEVIGFSAPKPTLERSWHTPGASAVYFCINPLTKGYAPLRDENVTEMRNFLVEFDKTKRASQEATIKKLKIPYNVKTWSGGKSLQLIVSLNEPCDSVEEYKLIFRMLVAMIPNIDDDVGTVSRLARIPDAVRDNGNKQTLLDVTGVKLTKKELLKWAYDINPIKFNNWKWKERWEERREEIRRQTPVNSPDNLPPYPFTLTELLQGRTREKGRHDAIKDACVWLIKEGYSLEQAEEFAYKAQDAVALERDDVPGIIKWVSKNIY